MDTLCKHTLHTHTHIVLDVGRNWRWNRLLSVNAEFDLDVSPKFKCIYVICHQPPHQWDNRDDLFPFSWNTNRPNETKWIEIKEDDDDVDEEIKIKCIFDQNKGKWKQRQQKRQRLATYTSAYRLQSSNIVSRAYGIRNSGFLQLTFAWIFISTAQSTHTRCHCCGCSYLYSVRVS